MAKIRCTCGREQNIVPADVGGGCTEAEAESVGWVRALDAWVCPFCAGNTIKLAGVLRQANHHRARR